jgi:hypothetical protein
MEKIAEIVLYAAVLAAGLVGLAITTCGGYFLLGGGLMPLGILALPSFAFGVLILVGVYKFLTRGKSTDT